MPGPGRTAVPPATLARAATLGALVVWAAVGVVGATRPASAGAVSTLLLACLWLGPRLPLAALAGSFAALFIAGELGLGEDPFLAGVIWACYLVGRHAALPYQPWAAAAVLLLLSANLLEPGRDAAAADVVFPVLLTAAPWLLGLSVQVASSRERLAVERAREVVVRRSDEIHRATAEERLRIARELHDVVAHGISAVSLQAQVARRAVERGTPVEVDQLRSIEQAAQQVMADTRQLLGVLRVEGDGVDTLPVPDLEALDLLVTECRAVGQDVVVRRHGPARELPPAMSAAAFRIVQECLANARRHGGDGTTVLTLGWSDHELSVGVRNPTPPGPLDSTSARREGHGLDGVEERARLFGGTVAVTAGPRTWEIEVRLPLPSPVGGGP